MIQFTMECCLVMQLADDANSECCTTCSDQAAVAILNPNSLVSRAAVADATHLQLAMRLHDAILSAAHFGQLNRPFYTQTLLHTDAYKTIDDLHTDALMQRRFYATTLLHTDAVTHKPFYTQTLLHADTFTQKLFYTQMLLHTDAFTQLTNAFTRRCFHT